MTDAEKNRAIAEALEPEPTFRNRDCFLAGDTMLTHSDAGLWWHNHEGFTAHHVFCKDPSASYAVEQALIAEGFIMSWEYDQGRWYLEIARTTDDLQVQAGTSTNESRLVALRDAAFEALIQEKAQ